MNEILSEIIELKRPFLKEKEIKELEEFNKKSEEELQVEISNAKSLSPFINEFIDECLSVNVMEDFDELWELDNLQNYIASQEEKEALDLAMSICMKESEFASLLLDLTTFHPSCALRMIRQDLRGTLDEQLRMLEGIVNAADNEKRMAIVGYIQEMEKERINGFYTTYARLLLPQTKTCIARKDVLGIVTNISDIVCYRQSYLCGSSEKFIELRKKINETLDEITINMYMQYRYFQKQKEFDKESSILVATVRSYPM